MDRSFFTAPALEVAPRLLGATLTLRTVRASGDPELSEVAIRITEVEAYHGVGVPGPYDPGSHARDRRTERNASMFGPPGHAYVYLSYGMHFALNLVCSPEGSASGVLLRAGEVIRGVTTAQQRRTAGRTDQQLAAHTLARGPGNLARALGINRPEHDGLDVLAAPFRLEPRDVEPPGIVAGPRVGVSGEAGSMSFPWRFWIAGDPSVSAYRPGRNVPKAMPAPRPDQRPTGRSEGGTAPARPRRSQPPRPR